MTTYERIMLKRQFSCSKCHKMRELLNLEGIQRIPSKEVRAGVSKMVYEMMEATGKDSCMVLYCKRCGEYTVSFDWEEVGS